MGTKRLSVIAALVALLGGAVFAALPAHAYTCWTQCSGYGNSRTCWTNCN